MARLARGEADDVVDDDSGILLITLPCDVTQCGVQVTLAILINGSPAPTGSLSYTSTAAKPGRPAFNARGGIWIWNTMVMVFNLSNTARTLARDQTASLSHLREHLRSGRLIAISGRCKRSLRKIRTFESH